MSSDKEIKRPDERHDRIHSIHLNVALKDGLTSKRIARLADELLELVNLE